MLSPKGNVVGFQPLIEAGALDITSAFTIILRPAMETAAPSDIVYMRDNALTVKVDLY